MQPGSRPFRAVFAAVAALARAEELPGSDVETSLAPGRAYVRRVRGHSPWLLYRLDAQHIYITTVRDESPLPIEE